jgi:hypothetical protein
VFAVWRSVNWRYPIGNQRKPGGIHILIQIDLNTPVLFFDVMLTFHRELLSLLCRQNIDGF